VYLCRSALRLNTRFLHSFVRTLAVDGRTWGQKLESPQKYAGYCELQQHCHQLHYQDDSSGGLAAARSEGEEEAGGNEEYGADDDDHAIVPDIDVVCIIDHVNKNRGIDVGEGHEGGQRVDDQKGYLHQSDAMCNINDSQKIIDRFPGVHNSVQPWGQSHSLSLAVDIAITQNGLR
jgi:hypothetical protein